MFSLVNPMRVCDTGTMTATAKMKQALRNVFKRHNVVVAYLFGSVARHSAGPKSDVDIAVLFSRPADSVEAGMKRSSALSSALEDAIGRTVDLIDLEEVHSPLLRHRAIRRGELLYSTDHDYRRQLEQKALHEFEDTRYLRAVQMRALKKRITEGTFGKPL